MTRLDAVKDEDAAHPVAAAWRPVLCEIACAQWMGTHWEVLVDLWTKEEGRSDLVLHVKVVEDGASPRFTVHLVYVP